MTYSQYPNLLAGGLTNEGDFVPFELFAGESDTVTGQGTAGSTALEQFRVVARDTDGTLIPWDNTVSAKPAIGITAQPIPAGTTGPIFIGGAFNHAALVWPSAVTTLPARKAAFDRTNVVIGAILGTGTPIAYT